jgi:hypothetical protein
MGHRPKSEAEEENIMLGGYVKNTSNCEGLELGWDANIAISEDLGEHTAAEVKCGEPETKNWKRRRVVGWSDLFFGTPVRIHAYRATANGANGILVCGGNSGIRILAATNDPDSRTEHDEHLPKGWGMPVLWLEQAADLVRFVD